jgi:hypothetical protein
MADVMFATQRPLAVAALSENATAAGWKTKPSWFHQARVQRAESSPGQLSTSGAQPPLYGLRGFSR